MFKGLLEDLVDRGLDLKWRYLVVIDGSKTLRASVERVFGQQVEVQRCQIHKRRNGKEYLPENCQKDYDRRMRNAYAGLACSGNLRSPPARLLSGLFLLLLPCSDLSFRLRFLPLRFLPGFGL